VKTSTLKKTFIILAHAFVGWMFCAATMGFGMAVLPMQTTLIIHAIAAPVFFFAVSLVYFKKFHFTSPWQTALIFVGFVIAMDLVVVALLILKSFEMFTSLLGTWIPFTLIAASTYLTGLFITKRA
jgi:hypothetical protein